MNSIQRQLTFRLVALSCLLWSAGSLAVYFAVRAGLVAEFDRTLTAKAQSLAALTSQKDGEVEFDFNPTVQHSVLRDAFRLWFPDGTTYDYTPGTEKIDLPKRVGTFDFRVPSGATGRAVGIRFTPVEDEESKKHARVEATVVVAGSRRELDRRLRLLATTLLLVGAGLAALTGIVVPRIVRQGLQPLAGLAQRAATIDAASLQLRFSTDALPAELQPIAGKLNELLARLETSFTRERQFSADVAHELRTPIAELRALAEVALKWPDDAPATKRALEDALAVALQMESIATALLNLARCESGQLPVRREPVALAPLVKDVCRNLPINVSVPSDATWDADPALLRVILANLVSNAVDYGQSARLCVEAGQISVSNTTDNLTADDLPHLFERFWRKDPARSSSTHTGLGLALCKAYADALGLDLRVELAHGILRFELGPAAASLRAR